MAWYTGDAWGLTATLSFPPMWANQRAVITLTREAEDA